MMGPTFLLLKAEQPINGLSSYNFAFYIDSPTPLSIRTMDVCLKETPANNLANSKEQFSR